MTSEQGFSNNPLGWSLTRKTKQIEKNMSNFWQWSQLLDIFSCLFTKWSLTGGGRLWEVVARRESTVIFLWLAFSCGKSISLVYTLCWNFVILKRLSHSHTLFKKKILYSFKCSSNTFLAASVDIFVFSISLYCLQMWYLTQQPLSHDIENKINSYHVKLGEISPDS